MLMNILRYTHILFLLILFNCSIIYPTKNPIDTINYMNTKEISKNLIIMLPGRRDTAGDFVKYGFIKALNESGIKADAVAVDAHFGYYYQRNLIPHIYNDVILPAKQKGYKNIWILGISIGGIGSLLYAKEHYNTLNGILILAPFLGDKEIIDEIKATGGLSKWNPKEPIPEEDYQQALWAWLKEYEKHSKNLPNLVLGYGRDDEFAPANGLLAEILPGDQVFVVSGSHEWDTWGRLFNIFLKSEKIRMQFQ